MYPPYRHFVCGELSSQEASTFCDIWQMTSCDFKAFFSFLTKAILFVFKNIYFDALDFSECRSEEVMFLLTLSV